MEVTDIKVWPFSKEGSNFLGNGSITFDNFIFVKFAVNKSPKDSSLWISWPSKKGKDKDGNEKWYPECGIIIDEEAEDKYALKNDVEKQIITAYNKALGISPKKDNKDSRFDYDNSQEKESQEKQNKEEEPIKKKIPLIKLRR